MALIKMALHGFKDETFATQTGVFNMQVNPSSLKLNKSTNYSSTNVPGQTDQLILDRPKASSLSFDFVLDDTGVIPDAENLPINNKIKNLEAILYEVKGESHEPNYIKAVWGTFSFQGRLTSLNYDYSLFKPDGSPLRVKISVTIEGNRKETDLKSPDLSRVITVKSGDTLPLLCKEFYDDPSYCYDVAKVNNLTTFRDIKPGTRLLFPPLVRYGSTIK